MALVVLVVQLVLELVFAAIKLAAGDSAAPLYPKRQSAQEDLERLRKVDDDELQRDVAEKLLTKLGYQVSTVDCGEAAVDLVREKPHELLILDMIMPGGIDGAETYRRILHIREEQKAIIVSGYAESERVAEALDLGAGAYHRKPLSLKTIALAVRDELDRSSSGPRN